MNKLDRFSWGQRTYVMGILNVTPDSFSGDGVLMAEDTQAVAVAQAEQFVRDGADIIDIGGESTRPGAQPLTAEEEAERILPVIKAVREALPYVTISVDTYRAAVAEAALQAGADWVNDIWGLQYDPEMAHIVARANCPVVIMHNGRNRPRLEREDGAGGYYGYYHYNDLVGEVKAELAAATNQALAAGISKNHIILDPGIGFGKTAPQNIELLRGLTEIKKLGYPLLLGTSRKGFIGSYLGNLPLHERVEGTAATVAFGIMQGVDMVRVHDVKEMTRIARMIDLLARVD